MKKQDLPEHIEKYIPRLLELERLAREVQRESDANVQLFCDWQKAKANGHEYTVRDDYFKQNRQYTRSMETYKDTASDFVDEIYELVETTTPTNNEKK